MQRLIMAAGGIMMAPSYYIVLLSRTTGVKHLIPCLSIIGCFAFLD